jgi:hypothetical protein
VTEIFEADNSAPYYLKQERNYVFDDENDLRTNGSFLLTTGNVTTQDENASNRWYHSGIWSSPKISGIVFRPWSHQRTTTAPFSEKFWQRCLWVEYSFKTIESSHEKFVDALPRARLDY